MSFAEAGTYGRFEAVTSLLLALALAMPALALPCAAMGLGADMAMDEACPVMEAMKTAKATGSHCDGMTAPATDGPRFARALPDCCVVSSGEPAATPSGLLVTTPQPTALRPAAEAQSLADALTTNRPAPAPSPPRSGPTPLFTLHASLLI